MSRAWICATVTGKTTAELRARRDAQVGADLVELRLDTVDRPDVAAALAGRRTPVVVTCRPAREGGSFAGSEAERQEILFEAARQGAEYIDVEHEATFAEKLIRSRQGQGMVVSYHAFDHLPSDLDARYRAMRATGAEVVKVAVAVKSLNDTVQVASLGGTQEEPGRGRRVLVAMGPAGIPSRLLAGRFGSCWTYAGDGIAPGQIDLPRMRDQFRVGNVTSRTAIYGVLGAPIGHSVSPAMHNAGFRAAGIDAVYLPLEARSADDFTAFARAVNLRGASVTAPFKEAVAERISVRDDVSTATGAVNTLRIADGRWVGCNTDVPGFLAPLVGRLRLADARATILGAGGAARAAAYALQQAGAIVTVCARRTERAAEVAHAVGVAAAPLPPGRGSWDLLVNTTPVGTFPNVEASPLPDGPFDGQLVYDLVYNPAKTRLLADAARAGCETIGGLAMLVAQAEEQFAWWTGRRPPTGLFREAAEADLARQGRAANGGTAAAVQGSRQGSDGDGDSGRLKR